MKSTKEVDLKIKAVLDEIDELLMPYEASLGLIKVWTKGRLKFPFYISSEMMDTDIFDLDLSTRPYNSLKREKVFTIGNLVESIEVQEDLMKIRNMGKNSASEIMQKLLVYQFNRLKPERKKVFVKRIVELNLMGE